MVLYKMSVSQRRFLNIVFQVVLKKLPRVLFDWIDWSPLVYQLAYSQHIIGRICIYSICSDTVSDNSIDY